MLTIPFFYNLPKYSFPRKFPRGAPCIIPVIDISIIALIRGSFNCGAKFLPLFGNFRILFTQSSYARYVRAISMQNPRLKLYT